MKTRGQVHKHWFYMRTLSPLLQVQKLRDSQVHALGRLLPHLVPAVFLALAALAAEPHLITRL